MNQTSKKPSIFEFISLRSYIKSIASYQIEFENYSWRDLSNALKLKSSGHIFLILSGKRPLKSEHILSLIKEFNLSKNEQDFFFLIHNYDQTNPYTKKSKELRKQILNHPEARKAVGKKISRDYENDFRSLPEDYYDYFSSALLITIKELIGSDLDIRSAKDISRILKPWIKTPKAHKALASLTRLGIIEKRKDRYVISKGLEKLEQIKSTTRQHFNLAKKVNSEWLELAESAWENYDESEYSSLGYTLALSEEELKKLVIKGEKAITNLAFEADENSKNKTRAAHVQILITPLGKGEEK